MLRPFVVALCLAFLGLMPRASEAARTKMTLDAKASKITFTAEQSVLGSTEGTFKTFAGQFDVDPQDWSTASGTVSIDAKSIDTGKGDRDDHLRNADFFDVTKHPKIMFYIQSITMTSKTNAKVKARVTVKGKSYPVNMTAVLKATKGGLSAKAVFSVDRKKIGITYKAPFYIPTIKDRVQLAFDVKLVAR